MITTIVVAGTSSLNDVFESIYGKNANSGTIGFKGTDTPNYQVHYLNIIAHTDGVSQKGSDLDQNQLYQNSKIKN